MTTKTHSASLAMAGLVLLCFGGTQLLGQNATWTGVVKPVTVFAGDQSAHRAFELTIPDRKRDADDKESFPLIVETKGTNGGKILDLSLYVDHRVKMRGFITNYFPVEAADSNVVIVTNLSFPERSGWFILKTDPGSIRDLGRYIEPPPAEMPLSSTSLAEVIYTLTRQAGVNCTFDPQLFVRSPELTAGLGDQDFEDYPTLQHVPAKQALPWVLKEHGLKMVQNPATPSVVRIMRLNDAERMNDGSLLGSDTNDVHDLIKTDNENSSVIIREIAGQAHLNVMVDTNVCAPPHCWLVSFRWEHITARQALIALCDNYDLVMVKDAKTGVIRFKLRDK